MFFPKHIKTTVKMQIKDNQDIEYLVTQKVTIHLWNNDLYIKAQLTTSELILLIIAD